jgi:hypothetical protein
MFCYFLNQIKIKILIVKIHVLKAESLFKQGKRLSKLFRFLAHDQKFIKKTDFAQNLVKNWK